MLISRRLIRGEKGAIKNFGNYFWDQCTIHKKYHGVSPPTVPLCLMKSYSYDIIPRASLACSLRIKMLVYSKQEGVEKHF